MSATKQTATKRVKVLGLTDREGGRYAVLGMTRDGGLVEFTLYSQSSRELVESCTGIQIDLAQSEIAYWAVKEAN